MSHRDRRDGGANGAQALGYVLVGIYVGIVGVLLFKWVGDRFDRIERAASRGPNTRPIGVFPEKGSELDETLRDMRREHVREFATDLREEGLVVTEAPVAAEA
jgi:hypothetical protein